MTVIDYKFLETYFRERFSRPFARRFRYLYIGLERCDDTLILSDTEDNEFNYCEPMQATGLLKIHNPDHLAMIKAWLLLYGLDGSRPYLFSIGKLLTMLNKKAWENSVCHIRRESYGAVFVAVDDGPEEFIARPIAAYFALTKLQHYVDKYSAVFFTNTVPTYTHTFENPEAVSRNSLLPVSCQALHAAGILDQSCEDIKLVLLQGLDVLIIKSLVRKEVPYQSGIRVWADSGPRCLNYGGFFIDDDTSLCVVRDNIFIFPRPKQE